MIIYGLQFGLHLFLDVVSTSERKNICADNALPFREKICLHFKGLPRESTCCCIAGKEFVPDVLVYLFHLVPLKSKRSRSNAMTFSYFFHILALQTSPNATRRHVTATLELFCSSATQCAGLRVSSKLQGGLKFHCEFFWVEFRVQHGSTWFNSEF